MIVNYNLNFPPVDAGEVGAFFEAIKNLEEKMNKVQEAIDKALVQQDLVVAVVGTLQNLVQDIRDLLAMNDVAGAQALLDHIDANNVLLTNAILDGTEADNLADAAVLANTNAVAPPIVNLAPVVDPVVDPVAVAAEPLATDAPALDPGQNA